MADTKTDTEKLNFLIKELRYEFKHALRRQEVHAINLSAELLYMAKFGVSRWDDDLPVSWVQFYESLRTNAENEIAADRARAEAEQY